MRVKFLASSLHGDAGTIIAQAREELHRAGFLFAESDDAPEVLVLVTGGTELEAKRYLRPGSLLIPWGSSNGLAACLEVKAWADLEGLRVHILADPLSDPRISKTFNALGSIRGLRVGAIGAPSDWLIKSGDPELLIDLGALVEKMEPKDVLADREDSPDIEAQIRARVGRIEVSQEDLRDAIRFYLALKKIVKQKDLCGIAIRCFELVKDLKVSACLAVAILNSEGKVAACEGDLESLATLLVAQKLTGQTGFMANMTGYKCGVATFAHCTINLALVDRFDLVKHYETGESVAIRSDLTTDVATVFRLGKGRRFTLFEGPHVSHSHVEEMCRTQFAMRVDAEYLNMALGNHQIILPGAWGSELAVLSAFGWRRVDVGGPW